MQYKMDSLVGDEMRTVTSYVLSKGVSQAVIDLLV